MKYLILIYRSEEVAGQQGMDELQRWFDIDEEMQAAGVYVAGSALQGATTATTVRVRNDETLLTDGPFAETKEVLGGYYLVDVPDLDEALAWAAKLPSSTYGSNEVRPLMEFPDQP